jgi:hypothetical protein
MLDVFHNKLSKNPAKTFFSLDIWVIFKAQNKLTAQEGADQT